MTNTTALTVLSCGMGQDSVALGYKLLLDPAFRAQQAPDALLILMSDTGNEHSETYRYIPHFAQQCKQADVQFVFLPAGDQYHSGSWPSLLEFYERTKTVGAKQFRKTCTDNLKIKPIYRFLSEYVASEHGIARKQGIYQTKFPLVEFAHRYGKIRMLIGFARGEEKRAQKTRTGADGAPTWMRIAIDRQFPLQDLGMDRMDCQRYIESVGQPVPPPSMCRMCHFKGLPLLLLDWRERPEDVLEWDRLDRQKRANPLYQNLPTNQNIGPYGIPTVLEALETAKQRYGDWTTEKLLMWRNTHGHGCNTTY
jgi:3'-phosphoadenosine 5'-phosphosulfate sulfotransferase (PAPS reductase)/FAD synthetase